jgi:hypothetical protein
MALTTEQLNQIYMEELGRPAAAEGIQYWTQGGTSLTDPAQVRQAIAESQEAQQFKQSQPVATPAPVQTPTMPQVPQIPDQPASTDTFPVAPFAGTVAGGATPAVGSMALGELGLGSGTAPAVPPLDQNEVMYRADIDPTADLDAAYTSALGRTIGDEGKTFWRSEIDKAVASGVPYQTALNNAIAAITSSEEATNFKTTGVAQTNVPGSTVIQPAFTPVQPADIQGDLDAIYRSVLGPNRAIQQEGLDYFTNDYNTYRQQGATHEQALANIRSSIEQSSEADIYQGKVAQLTNSLNSVFNELLGRDLGKTGLDYWSGEYNKLIGQGMSATDAMNSIRNSIMQGEEYQLYQQTQQPYVVPEDERIELPGIPQPDDAIQNQMVQRAMTPAVPIGGAMQAAQIGEATPGQTIGAGVGQAPAAPTATAQTAGTTAQAMQPTMQPAAQVTAQDATPSVSQALQQVAPAQGSVSTQAQVEAAQMSPTATEVGTLGAAQITEAQQVQQPQSRTLQQGELVTAAADAQQAAAFAEEVTAATANATEAATVQGQLADLMTQFEDGAVPSWAAGAMRTANATLAARGLGSSSLAGQAIVQAAMESALPIASQDAQTIAQFELTNLSNRQERAMLAAQQRAQFIGQEFDQQFQSRVANAAKISDIANINFNAEQQVALENARLAQSVDLANLQNTQALVMAEAAQIANLETANLNNRQQAAVQNAQSFLQMDLTNLSNQQQTDMFKAQSAVQALFSDQAAENAARQFNASSENQLSQFFSNLQAQVSQFNATQTNAMNQFNVEETNAIEKFNKEIKAQRDQFNAQNQLVIEQSNAQWRRDIATSDTAAQNLANQFNAEAILDISNTAYAALWQNFEDQMEYAWRSAENTEDRINNIVLQKLSADATLSAAEMRQDASDSAALGRLATYAAFGSSWGGIF